MRDLRGLFLPGRLDEQDGRSNLIAVLRGRGTAQFRAQQQFSGQPLATAVHCIWRDLGCRPRAASLVPPFAACSAEKEISNDKPIKEAGY